MLKYLTKFVLDSLPSVVATIIGAYIVNHYIIPTAPKTPAPAVAAVNPGSAVKTETPAAAQETFAKGVAEKTAIEKTAEKSAEKSGDAAPVDSRKRHVSPRTASRTPTDAAPAVAAPSTEERRDANDLARAAIERLRATSEPPRTVAVAPTQPTPVALPPLTTANAPSLAPDVFNTGTAAIGTAARPPQTGTMRSADASKPMPPAAIPGPPPMELHDDIVVPNRVTSVADDVVSAAKSMIHAVLPR